MAHIRKGQTVPAPEWRKHLRPWRKRLFWKRQRHAFKREFQRRDD
jgi:hypothetical protein